MILTIITFIIILALLILAHEFGHFVAAKKSGVKVEEFAFGFPPRLFSIKRGETNYTINALPLGGYVKMLGELEHSKDKRAFENQTRWKRFLISVSGVLMNLILAWVLLTIGFSVGMSPIVSPADQIPGKKLSNEVIIADYSEKSPAKDVGFLVGDVIKDVSAKDSAVVVNQFADLTNFTDSHAGQAIVVTYVRDGDTKTQEVTLLDSTDAPLGVILVERSVIRVPWYKSFYIAAREEYRVAVFTFEFLGSFIHDLFATGKAGEGVGGPVAIYTYTGVFLKMGILALIQFVAMLSINLAIINILPIPALDGGRILFIIIESIARKKIIKEKVENIIHTVGFAFLLLLIALITYGDIIKLIKK